MQHIEDNERRMEESLQAMGVEANREWSSPDEIRAYFDENNIRHQFGGTNLSQEELSQLAEYVIANHKGFKGNTGP